MMRNIAKLAELLEYKHHCNHIFHFGDQILKIRCQIGY